MRYFIEQSQIEKIIQYLGELPWKHVNPIIVVIDQVMKNQLIEEKKPEKEK